MRVSAPGSVAEPVNVSTLPSFPDWLAPALAVGATLLTVSGLVAVPTPPSLSVTVSVTV